MHWNEITEIDRMNLLNQAAAAKGLPAFAIEKDWWMVQILRVIFAMPVASHLLFKGGSALSKAWRLIERFSEDIDLALDRTFLGFSGSLTRTQVGKLRDKSFHFLSGSFYKELLQSFFNAGFAGIEIKIAEPHTPDQDPLIFEIYYPHLIDTSSYIKPRILLEIGSRSLMEPSSDCSFCSMVGEVFHDTFYADHEITVPCVNPERTFLEKLFLLHEEFQRPQGKARVDRLSRHLYDIFKLSFTPYADRAKKDAALYKSIVAHREYFTHLGGVDYRTHFPPYLNPVPPAEVLPLWEKDYKVMQQEMIYGESPSFAALIERMEVIRNEFNQLVF